MIPASIRRLRYGWMAGPSLPIPRCLICGQRLIVVFKYHFLFVYQLLYGCISIGLCYFFLLVTVYTVKYCLNIPGLSLYLVIYILQTDCLTSSYFTLHVLRSANIVVFPETAKLFVFFLHLFFVVSILFRTFAH